MKFFYVSPQRLPVGQALRLAHPTSHKQSSDRKLSLESKLGEAGQNILHCHLKHCGDFCALAANCPARQPCEILQFIANTLTELHHRANQLVEHIFEFERREHFPDLPSRFSVFFCWETLDHAKWFWDTYRKRKGYIYEVAPAKEDVPIHRGDMKWLDCLVLDIPTIQVRAHAYWSGQPYSEKGGEKWELLVQGDLFICRELG